MGDSYFQTPFPPPSEVSSESASSSREMTAAEAEYHGIDEPYAKLIHRALMSAPDHSMVLQEIYQWFRENTHRGASDTKGWMNSIRHNLSMNAAFKKTERKMPGDETKKSTEWVLEDFAIRDGVQSTTRYRRATGNKKFAKSETPTHSRHTPPRSRAKFQRQRAQENNHSSSRHSPYPSADMKGIFLHSRNFGTDPQLVGTGQLSPRASTHSNITSGSPYFYPDVKPEPLDPNYTNLPIYTLEDVHGVCTDGPLFSHQQPVYNTTNGMCNNAC
ncbi:hypothetical protein BJ878DRAFT_427841 [Calycina marina]|uniref:Fork-head domain-containing protein n=1 Tax=Calycina marina TaxID=1763456 RepID=A0A9P7YXC7_9HELO|nr:hypothetical protein BJ878DRAFT_427841 [Calycina marina]